MTEPTPTWRAKVGFWIVMGMLSTAFAEVCVASAPFPFFQPWGVLVTTPLYTLHMVVLATVLVRWRKLSWAGLLFAGALFGLYEAPLTKVLWNPEWLDTLPRFAEVAWFHLVLLVLWWHPIFAFILPLCFGEILMTRSRHVQSIFTGRWHAWLSEYPRRSALVVAILCGGISCANMPDLVFTVLSPLINALLLGGLIVAWQRWGPGRIYTLESLLPGPLGFKATVAGLALLYAVLGVLLLPERLPGPAGYLAIGACYVLFIAALFYVPEQRYRQWDSDPLPSTPILGIVQFAVLGTVVALLTKLVLGGLSVAIILVLWACACTIGVYLYGRALWKTFRDASGRGGVRPMGTVE